MILWLPALLLMCAPVFAGEIKAWVPARIEHQNKQDPRDFAIYTGGVFRFGNGKTKRVDMVELAYIGLSPSGGNISYLIFSGSPCDGCDAKPTTFIHSPRDGLLKREAPHYRFRVWFSPAGYPGKLNCHLDGSLGQESCLYLGGCLPDKGEMALWYDKYKDDPGAWKNGAWKNSVYMLRVRGGRLHGGELHGDFLKAPLPAIAQTLGTVHFGLCREFPGRNMTSES